MVRVLFVCLGNICRSPLAQGIFERHLQERKIEKKYIVDSAGTSGWHAGEKPHIGSIQVAKKNGVSIENQSSRPVEEDDAAEFDFFVAMDESNYRSLIQEFGFHPEKVILLRQFDPQGSNKNVPDPYGMDTDRFEEVYEIIDRSMGPFLDHIENLTSSR